MLFFPEGPKGNTGGGYDGNADYSVAKYWIFRLKVWTMNAVPAGFLDFSRLNLTPPPSLFG